nr:MAG TPA: hypothetical protein [Caudoviricetes sp.]DAH61107.1 MAG TPA: hypothetical protein [Caudoviricetes sp.]DAL38752.1 MAG TPA_asm: hypothetical protein [Caudoviricetes sp.]
MVLRFLLIIPGTMLSGDRMAPLFVASRPKEGI